MAKRVVTKIGDVFCVDFRNGKKGYFQYVAKDMTMMNSSVIRAFYTHYPVEQEVSIEEIVKDKVAFYAHTILRGGIDFGLWKKVGKSKDIDDKNIQKVIFGRLTYDMFSNRSDKNSLRIWSINRNEIFIGFGWRLWKFKLEPGWISSIYSIVQRMYSGYDNFTSTFWEISKRQPRPEYRSYIELVEDGTKYFLCYKGDNLDRCIVIEDKGVKVYSAEEAKAAKLKIAYKKFSDTNWRYRNFLTPAEFKERWDNAEQYLRSGDPKKVAMIEEMSLKSTDADRELEFLK